MNKNSRRNTPVHDDFVNMYFRNCHYSELYSMLILFTCK
jgi:predicted nucleic-acid-binding Zn-ribbon protein